MSAGIARWRLAAIVLTGVLIVLGVAWETFLAPLRPGGSLLAFKVLPLVFGLAAFRKDRLRHYQLWTMLILAYLCEGVVRGMSDAAPSSMLGWLEALLAAAIYVSLTRYVQLRRREADAVPAGGPSGGSTG
jgi:uncharacterized membrane protein